MNVTLIPLEQLLIALIPVAMVGYIYFRWSLESAEIIVAVARMAVQLLLIGFFLAWIFEQKHLLAVGCVLLVMSCASTWIALRKIKPISVSLYLKTMAVISASSLFTLLIVVVGVLALDPVDNNRFVIPLAGMIFSSSMTAIGLSAERYYADRSKGVSYQQARNAALGASLIPITNAMLAVGLVALPGMMTGQILSGVSPHVAVRYQIVVMCMIFGASGLSSALFLAYVAKR